MNNITIIFYIIIFLISLSALTIGLISYTRHIKFPTPTPKPTPLKPSVNNIKKFYSDKGINILQDVINCCGSKLQPMTPYSNYKFDEFWEALSNTYSILDLGDNLMEGVVIVAGMLAQFMHEAANFSTCDEYNLGNSCNYGPCSCGQYGSNYM